MIHYVETYNKNLSTSYSGYRCNACQKSDMLLIIGRTETHFYYECQWCGEEWRRILNLSVLSPPRTIESVQNLFELLP